MNNNKKLKYYYDVGSANVSECTFTVRKPSDSNSILLYIIIHIFE